MSKSMKKHGQKGHFQQRKKKNKKNKYFGSRRGSEVLEQPRSSDVKILIWKNQKFWRGPEDLTQKFWIR